MTTKFRINGKDYTWSSLNRLPKERLLAEAQKLGSTVDSTTTWTKADLADLVIYLSDKKASAIFDYWQNYTGGWVRVGETGIVEVEDFSETVIYDSREEAVDDLLPTIREWAKDDTDARKFLESIGEEIPSASPADDAEAEASALSADERTFIYEYDETDLGCKEKIAVYYDRHNKLALIAGVEDGTDGLYYYSACEECDFFTVSDKARFCQFLIDHSDCGTSAGTYESIEDIIADNADDDLLRKLYIGISPDNEYYTIDGSSEPFLTWEGAAARLAEMHEDDVLKGRENYSYTIYVHRQ